MLARNARLLRFIAGLVQHKGDFGMAFGLMMLALTGLCTYFYLAWLRNNGQQPAIASDRDLKLAERAANLKAEMLSGAFESLSTCREGTLVRLQDAGLTMLNIDGIVRGRNTLKQGSRRWIETELDQGRTLYSIWSQSPESGEHLLSLQNPDFSEVGLCREDFRVLNQKEPDHFSWEGSSWQKIAAFAAQYTRGGNELESIPCLCWWYDSSDQHHRLQLIRWPDSDMTLSLQVRVKNAQITLLSDPDN